MAWNETLPRFGAATCPTRAFFAQVHLFDQIHLKRTKNIRFVRSALHFLIQLLPFCLGRFCFTFVMT
jgi:hypothetical protein